MNELKQIHFKALMCMDGEFFDIINKVVYLKVISNFSYFIFQTVKLLLDNNDFLHTS
jgi:hypothetical protein